MEQNQFAPCPKCGQANAKKVGYTWWGGALGPRMLNHVKCNNCGAEYNGKTGQSNTTGIIVYSVAIILICFLLFALLQMVQSV